MYKVTIYADSASGVPEPLDNWAVGSECLILDTQDIKILNNERMWV